MRSLIRAGFLFALIFGCAALCSAQGFSVTSDAPPPSAQKGSDESQTFISLQGRFTISLPREVSAYSGIGTNVPEGRIEGDSFSWETAEGAFEVSYMDLPAALATKAVFDRGRDNRLLLNRKAKLTGEEEISLAGNVGRATRFETPEGIQIVRAYLVGNRLYEASVALPNSLKPKEEAAVRLLDSFKLLSQAEVAAARKREADEVAASPLPQDKPVPKLKSDAEDEGLKGMVKTVFEEDQDLSGTWSVSGRKPSSRDYYDEKGQFTKRESYDYKGNLYEVSVYGYVDGERVRSEKTVRHEYDPPPVTVAAGPPTAGARPKSDPRYSYRFRYKYDEKGRLIEEDWYGSDGRLWLRYVYKFEGDKKEELVYSEDGSLNQRYVFTLDSQGNEVEKIDYDVKDGSVDERYSYAYEFDAKGNWTKKTASKWVTKGGKSFFEPSYVTYRTITYY
ncbi:MAG: hypothetical protein ACJ754_10845 [Pyrinomonadaceae bacterium]